SDLTGLRCPGAGPPQRHAVPRPAPARSCTSARARSKCSAEDLSWLFSAPNIQRSAGDLLIDPTTLTQLDADSQSPHRDVGGTEVHSQPIALPDPRGDRRSLVEMCPCVVMSLIPRRALRRRQMQEAGHRGGQCVPTMQLDGPSKVVEPVGERPGPPPRAVSQTRRSAEPLRVKPINAGSPWRQAMSYPRLAAETRNHHGPDTR